MTIDVQGPNGVVIKFPDGTDAATIDRVMRQSTGLTPAAAPSAAPPLGPSPAGASQQPVPTGELRPYEPGFFENIGNRLYDAANAIGLPGERMRRDVQGVDAAVRGAADTATFGLADEIAAGLGSATGVGGQAGNYEGNLEAQRAIDERDRIVNPGARMGGQILGAVGTIPLTGGINVLKAPAAVAESAPLVTRGLNALARGAARVGNEMATGAAYGAGYGFGSAEGGEGARLEGLLEGGGTGAAIGAVAPAVVGGVKKIGGAIAGHPLRALQRARNPNAAADRLVRDAVANDAAMAGLSIDQSVARMEGRQQAGLPVLPLDMGANTRGLARTARNVSPDAEDMLKSATSNRVATQYDRLEEFFSRPDISPGINAPQTRRVLEEAARRTNDARYKTAYAKGARGIWSPELEALTASGEVQTAIRDAIKRSKSEAVLRGQQPTGAPFVEGPSGTLVPAPGVRPTLEFWDQVQRSLRDLGNRQSGGRMNENAALYSRLRGHLNSILDSAVPEFNAARTGAYGYFGADDAIEAGVNFANLRGNVLKMDEARQAFDALSPAEKSLFREGYVSELLNKWRGVSDRYSLTNRVFGNRGAREQFDLVLGPAATRELEARMRVEDLMDMGRNAVQGNSTTAAQQIAAQIALTGGRAAAGGVVGSVITGDPFSPGTLIAAAMSASIGRGVGNITARVDQQMMRRVAEMLTSSDPQVVKEAIKRVGASPKLMNALRAGHEWATRSLIPAYVKDGASAPALVDTGTGSQPAQADN